jgi:hypothetical protein
LKLTEDYLNVILCKNKVDRLCPFVKSLIISVRSYLYTYLKPRSLNEYYRLIDQTEKFNDFYRFARSIGKYSNNKDVFILSLDQGNKILEYLSDYSVKLELKNNNFSV